jgi:hypothetical protein
MDISGLVETFRSRDSHRPASVQAEPVRFLGYYVRPLPSGTYVVIAKYSDGTICDMESSEMTLAEATRRAEHYQQSYFETERVRRATRDVDPNVGDIPAGAIERVR